MSKPHIFVACGVLRDAQGRVLIVERPPGKIAALKWEFPGGKIETAETPREALDRELHEEIGITVRAARPLLLFTHEYAERKVTLHTWLVTDWDGTAHGRESQRLVWHWPGTELALDVLPTVAPILHALQLPSAYVFTPPHADAALIQAGLDALPRGALLRLRLPALDDAAYADLAAQIVPAARTRGLRTILDRDAALVSALDADGLHWRQATLMSAGARPDDASKLLIASCHDMESLQQAALLGCDAAVLGPVRRTRTHPGQTPLGWEGFSALAAAINLPVYAIGGLGAAQCETAFAHHAQGVAGISAYWSRSGS